MTLDAEFKPLPVAEVRRLLGKYRGKKNGGGAPRDDWANQITLVDVARECHTTRYRLYSVLDGTPTDAEIGPAVMRRLSRFLLRCEAGLIEKKDGKLRFHAEPTKPPETVHRLTFRDNGRPVVRIGMPHPMATNFPSFFAVDPLNKKANT